MADHMEVSLWVKATWVSETTVRALAKIKEATARVTTTAIRTTDPTRDTEKENTNNDDRFTWLRIRDPMMRTRGETNIKVDTSSRITSRMDSGMKSTSKLGNSS